MATPIITNAGPQKIDVSIVPYMRAGQVEVITNNLRPGKGAYYWFDQTPVNQFVQTASILNVEGASAINISQGDGIYCQNTHAYATVISVSPNTAPNVTTIYINENYLTLNLYPVGANAVWNSGNTSDYKPGDIIFQIINVPANGNTSMSATFMGMVEYWNPVEASLSVSPISGTIFANSISQLTVNANSVIYKMTDNQIAYTLSVVGANGGTTVPNFPNANAIILTSQTSPNLLSTNTTSAYVQNHGLIINANTLDTTYTNINLPSADYAGTRTANTLYIVSGTGIGSNSQITSASGNTVITSNPLYVNGTSAWTIGVPQVDHNGMTAGIFTIPETATFNFLSGQRTLTITDTPDSVDSVNGTMRAQAYYTASPSIFNTSDYRGTPTLKCVAVQPPGSAPVAPVDPSSRGSVTSTQTLVANTAVSDTGTYLSDNDPLAQTFTTPAPKSVKQNYGIFATSVDLWFKNVPTGSSPQLPVIVSLVTTNNGFPTSTILSQVAVHCADVKVSNVPDSANIGSLIANNSTSTRFTFPDPVYLDASTQYAIVVHSDSPDYQSFVSDIGSYNISYGSNSSITVGGSQQTNIIYTYLTQPEAFSVSDVLVFGAAKGVTNPTTRDSIVQETLQTYRSTNPGDAVNAAQSSITYYAVDPTTGNVYQMTNIIPTSTQSKVSAPPNVGSLYLAQNSSTWNPLKNQMLMFVLNRAVFNTTPTQLKFNVSPPVNTIAMDSVVLNSDDIAFPSSSLTYALETTYLSNQVSPPVFKLNPTAKIVAPGVVYNFNQDYESLSMSNTREKYILPGNANTIIVNVTMQTNDPDVSPIFNIERFSALVGTNIISPGYILPPHVSISNSVNVISKISSTYNVQTFVVTIDPPTSLVNNVQATANITASQISSNGNITGINMINLGAGYIQTPNITITSNAVAIATGDAVANSNVILNLTTSYGSWSNGLQVNGAGIPNGTLVLSYNSTQLNLSQNVTQTADTITVTGNTVLANTTVSGENRRYNGNSVARYQTREIILANGFASGDLRVFVDGIIPNGTAVNVYYKVLSGHDSDTILNKNWQLMTAVSSVVNSPDHNTPIEIAYAPGPLVNGQPSGTLSYVEYSSDGIPTTYPLGGTFQSFQVKIVMISDDPTDVPNIIGLRAVALPPG